MFYFHKALVKPEERPFRPTRFRETRSLNPEMETAARVKTVVRTLIW